MGGMVSALGISVIMGADLVRLFALTVTGVVRDPTGYPMNQTLVWAVTDDCLNARHSTTDKSGHYRFAGLSPGTIA
jgi:protocatechuate 3,4-dioxygenase beta subunit